MKFKEQYIYYGLCAVTAMLLIVAVINKREMKQDQLRETKKQEQSQEQKKAEEKDTGSAVIRVLIRGEGSRKNFTKSRDYGARRSCDRIWRGKRRIGGAGSI